MLQVSFPVAAVLLLVGCDAPERTEKAPAEARAAANETPAPRTPEFVAIPAQFVGRYAADPVRCGEHGELSLEIAPNRLQFYESAGIPAAIGRIDARTVDVMARFSGEGTTWTRSHRLALAAEGKTLTVTSADSSVTRVRCPA